MDRLVATLKKKNIRVSEIPKWGVYFRKVWEKRFAAHLNDEEKQSIYLGCRNGWQGYLWHVFSYQTKECLQEEAAERAFNREPKGECYLFYQLQNDVLILQHAGSLTADDFPDRTDLYVVDRDFTWTFVKTHETKWFGPYFSRCTEDDDEKES